MTAMTWGRLSALLLLMVAAACRSDGEVPSGAGDEGQAPSPINATAPAQSAPEGGAYIVGTANNDSLTGGGFDDEIFGGSGSDAIVGGEGNDVLYGDGFAVSPATKGEASRFLGQATFGPTMGEIDALMTSTFEEWILSEFDKPASLILPDILQEFGGTTLEGNGEPNFDALNSASHAHWETIVGGADQLRQRVAYALSQILVISHGRASVLSEHQDSVAAYMDIMTEGAFGNYRDLLEDVTYSPAMAAYLTYLWNLPEDMESGRVPDENYAREIMQLFTIGLVELNMDGTPKRLGGELQETYTNDDVRGLAKVFTGLGLASDEYFEVGDFENFYLPLNMFEEFHAPQEKSFLGTFIPPNTSGVESVGLALDALVDHPNTAPFVAKQLIQRLITSNPSPAYVRRVAVAFANGEFTMPSGAIVGDGRRGDMKATIAALLMDVEARSLERMNTPTFGKVREPVLRFTHWARAFEVPATNAEDRFFLSDSSAASVLGQHPYKSPSVFNFYRPGYVAPGTQTGAIDLTAPELQIVNASSAVGYGNTITAFVADFSPTFSGQGSPGFRTDYPIEYALSPDPAALIDRLDLLLTHDTLSDETRQRIIDVLQDNPIESFAVERLTRRRVHLAIVAIMTSPDYLVQR